MGRVTKIPVCKALVLLVCWMAAGVAPGASLTAKMLAKDTALIEVEGKSRMLRAGQTSPEGLKLIRASRAGAEVEYQGKNYTLTLERRIATGFAGASVAQVRISSGAGGHYSASGQINGSPVEFLIDTGATTVALSGEHAQRLGINYLAGEPAMVSTASGNTTAYRIWLDRVSVGMVEVKHVEAVVIPGSAPQTILLGNSFLSLVDMRTEQGVLVLTSRL